MVRRLLRINNIPKIAIRILVFLFITLTATNVSYSQNMPVPENIQAALLPKVLKFSTTLSQNSKLRMLIVYNNNSATSKDDLIRGLGSAMEVKAVQSSELPSHISKYDLVYFMPGVSDLASLCKIYKVLSVSGISQYVEDGEISIAFGLQNNKPKIFVNLTSLAKEGQSLSSEILRIAKVYN